jgi:hypothetical protein
MTLMKCTVPSETYTHEMSSFIISTVTFMSCMMPAEATLSRPVHQHGASDLPSAMHPVAYLFLAAAAIALTVLMINDAWYRHREREPPQQVYETRVLYELRRRLYRDGHGVRFPTPAEIAENDRRLERVANDRTLNARDRYIAQYEHSPSHSHASDVSDDELEPLTPEESLTPEHAPAMQADPVVPPTPQRDRRDYPTVNLYRM